MGTIHYSSAMNAPAPLPGCVYFADPHGTGNGTFADRTAVSQISRATISGAFNGSRDLGYSLDGAILHFDNAADATAWVAGLNALAISTILGIVHALDGMDLVVTFSDDQAHTLANNYAPDTPDLDLGAFTNDQDAVPAPSIGPGMAVVWADRARRIVEAPRPNSTLADFAGFVTLASRLPDDLAAKLGNGVGLLADGQSLEFVRKGTGTLAVAPGVAVSAGDPVFLGRIAGEAGYFFPSDDVGNTRLEIPGAQFMQAATGAGLTRGVQAMFI